MRDIWELFILEILNGSNRSGGNGGFASAVEPQARALLCVVDSEKQLELGLG